MKILVEKDVLTTRLDDELALLNQKNGRYFSLNRTGTRVWELLKENGDTEKTIDSLLLEYNVDENVLRNDFEKIMLQLVQAELVMQS